MSSSERNGIALQLMMKDALGRVQGEELVQLVSTLFGSAWGPSGVGDREKLENRGDRTRDVGPRARTHDTVYLDVNDILDNAI